MDSVPVLVDDSESAEHVKSVIDPALHVLEVHAHALRTIDFEDPSSNVRPRGFSVMHNFFKNFF
jgi:hypothetical protein